MAEGWFRVAARLQWHAKTRELSRLLGVSTHEAAGVLICLWGWAFETVPDGDVSGRSARQIASAIDWLGDADEFVQALVAAGWLDLDGTSLRFHEWENYGGLLHSVRAKDAGRKRNSTGIPRNSSDERLAPVTDEAGDGSDSNVSAHTNNGSRAGTPTDSTGTPSEVAGTRRNSDMRLTREELELRERVESRELDLDPPGGGEEEAAAGCPHGLGDDCEFCWESPRLAPAAPDGLTQRQREVRDSLLEGLGRKGRDAETQDAMAVLVGDYDPEYLEEIRRVHWRDERCTKSRALLWPRHVREHILELEEAQRVATWGDEKEPNLRVIATDEDAERIVQFRYERDRDATEWLERRNKRADELMAEGMKESEAMAQASVETELEGVR